MASIKQPAANDGRISLAAGSQRTLVVRHGGPRRLGMPQQDQLPARVSCNHETLSGPGCADSPDGAHLVLDP